MPLLVPVLVAATPVAVPARPFTPRARNATPASAVEERLERREAATREAVLMRAIAAPSMTWGDTRHAHPLEILAHILGGGTGSRLHRALVGRQAEAQAAVRGGGRQHAERRGSRARVLRRGAAEQQRGGHRC